MTTEPLAPFTSLLALQDLDSALDQLRHRRAHLPERTALAAIETEATSLTWASTARRVERDALAARQSKLEADAAVGEAKKLDLNRKLKVTYVPREAETLQAEIASLTTRLSGLDDQQLELMEQLEPIETTLADDAARSAQLVEQAVRARQELAGAESAMDGEMSQLTARRPELLATAPEALVAKYEKMRVKLAGVAIARLVNGHCSGCNLALSSGELDRIRHEPADTFVECEQCGRILVH